MLPRFSQSDGMVGFVGYDSSNSTADLHGSLMIWVFTFASLCWLCGAKIVHTGFAVLTVDTTCYSRYCLFFMNMGNKFSP